MSDTDPDTEADAEIDAQDTTSTQVRWEYTNDVIAGGYLLAYILLTAVDGYWVINLSALPTGWRMATVGIALIATAWTFGGGAVRAASKFTSG